MQGLVFVMVGGALGAGLRHGFNIAVPRFLGLAFPWHTVLVNVLGSFLMGVLIAWLAGRPDESASLRLFLATGVLGGFTTFSAFSLDFFTLWERGNVLAAFGYVLVSVVVSLLAIYAGFALMRWSV